MKLFFVIVAFCTLIPSNFSEMEEDESMQSPKFHFASPYLRNYYSGDTSSGYHDYRTQNCKNPIPCLDRKLIPNQNTVNTKWLHRTRVFYQTMGSCWGYSELAKIHLGRPPRSDFELDSMCSVQVLGNETNYYSGYGTQFQTRCVSTPEDRGRVCVNTFGDYATDTTYYSPFRYYVIETDGESFALFYRCIQKRWADYALVSTRPVINQQTLQFASARITKMGFPADQIRSLKCKLHGGGNKTPAFQNQKPPHQYGY